jgi:N-acetylmuramoyl-L-alanine amidase
MQNRLRYTFILVVLLASITVFAQQTKLKIKFADGEKSIGVVVKNGVAFVPSKDFADALSIGSFFNPANKKIEYSIEGFKIKFTANNPYVVKTESGSVSQAIQLPVPTSYINKQIYIPLEYSVKIINSCCSNKLNFNKGNLVLTVSAKGKATEITEAEPKVKKEDETETDKDISRIIISEKANGTLISVKLNKKNIKHECTYKKNTLSLLLKGNELNIDEPEITSKKGLVKDVKIKKQSNATLINFDLNPGYESHDLSVDEDGKSLLLTIRNDKFKHKSPDKKGKWDFDVVVIDAGHGGKDAGAIGVNGIKEKDVNLAIALKLGKLIENNISGVKVVYTRKTDTFVELYKRGKIANENNGKLFISIHCNSTPQKPSDAMGTEIYLLRPGRTESAIKIAERENSVIKYEDNPSRYQKLTDENFILVSMAHSSYMKYSEKFSDYLNNNFMNEPTVKSRGVKQAGFYVLIGASMPGVLVESGFISNPHDAKLLGSKEGQSKIANSVFEAVKKFKDYYDKVIETDS